MFVLDISYPQKIVNHHQRQTYTNILTEIRTANSASKGKVMPASIGKPITREIINMSHSKVAQPLNKSRIVFNSNTNNSWFKENGSNIVKSSLRRTVPTGSFLSTF